MSLSANCLLSSPIQWKLSSTPSSLLRSPLSSSAANDVVNCHSLGLCNRERTDLGREESYRPREGGRLTFRGGPISHDIPLLLPKCTMSARAGCARLSDVSAKDSASCCNCAHHRCLCNICSREREQAEGKVGKLENSFGISMRFVTPPFRNSRESRLLAPSGRAREATSSTSQPCPSIPSTRSREGRGLCTNRLKP